MIHAKKQRSSSLSGIQKIFSGYEVMSATSNSLFFRKLTKNIMTSDESEYINLFFFPPIGILNLDDLVQRYVLHYIFVPRINHVITSFKQGWNSHPLRSEKNWTPKQIWTNGMIDQRRRGILHIAEINDIPVGSEDLEWFGMEWYAPHPADDGLATMNVDDVSSPLNQEQETILRRINPLTLSATFGIDLFLNAMNIILS